jgi:hypothetical protein
VIAFYAFIGTLVVLGVPTAIVLAADAAHEYRRWKRDRARRRAGLELGDRRRS